MTTPATRELQRPEWVLLGIQGPDGVTVMASSDLTRAQLDIHYHLGALWPDGPFYRREPDRVARFELRTDMGSIVMTHGATYAEAMRAIFDAWSPDGEPTPQAIEP